MATNSLAPSLYAAPAWREVRPRSLPVAAGPRPQAPCLGIALAASAALWGGLGSIAFVLLSRLV